jgi:hypothetical protein
MSFQRSQTFPSSPGAVFERRPRLLVSFLYPAAGEANVHLNFDDPNRSAYLWPRRWFPTAQSLPKDIPGCSKSRGSIGDGTRQVAFREETEKDLFSPNQSVVWDFSQFSQLVVFLPWASTPTFKLENVSYLLRKIACPPQVTLVYPSIPNLEKSPPSWETWSLLRVFHMNLLQVLEELKDVKHIGLRVHGLPACSMLTPQEEYSAAVAACEAEPCLESFRRANAYSTLRGCLEYLAEFFEHRIRLF